MGWREQLKLLEKYEGKIGLATEREIELAGRGIAPEVARQIAVAEYEWKKRLLKNYQNQNNRTDTCNKSLFNGSKT
jgi:hypothetical protein